MIYFDNSATTQVDSEVVEAMLPYLHEEYGNPSSKYYTLAVNASKAVEQSREYVAELLEAKPEEIVFTAGATESTNLIIKGVADYRKYYEQAGNHIITSTVEHHATLNTCHFLNGDIYSNSDASFSLGASTRKVDRGYSVSFVNVNEYGQVTPEAFEKAIMPTTILASFIWGNNEIGSLNDMDGLCTIAHKHNVPLHADGTQVIGKIPVSVKQTSVDYVSLSAHKFGGPKGVGAAFIRGDMYGLPPISALLHGGSQEEGVRAGTLAVHNIVGMGKAAELAIRNLDEKSQKLHQITLAAKELLAQCDFVSLLGDPQQALPGVLSIVVDDQSFNNERFIRAISKEFAVSTGSACTAGKPSHVLAAIGRSKDTSKVIRLSLDVASTVNDVELFIAKLKNYLGR